VAVALVAAVASTHVPHVNGTPRSAAGPESIPRQYAAAVHAAGFPDASDTGVPAGMLLRAVPGQVASGPGWHYDPRGWVEVDGNGAVLSGLYIPCNLDISASDVTIRDVRVIDGGGSSFGISLRHTANVTIENSTVSGLNSTAGRVGDAIDDIYGDSTGIVIKDNNISDWRTGVQVSSGLITGNYIHSPGFAAGDHTNGIYDTGSAQPLTIVGNTIYNSYGQTDDITLQPSAAGQDVANKIIEGNLLAGGGYAIYGGLSRSNSTSDIVIKDNEFSRIYFAGGGRYGPVADFNPDGSKDAWAGNAWFSDRQAASRRAGAGRSGAVGSGVIPAP
jgi:hypothetical protein